MPATATMAVKRFDKPDEVRPFAGHGRVDVLDLAGHKVMLGTFEPGWKWSADVKPIAGTDSCEVSHLGYVVSGRMRVMMDGAAAIEIGPGDAVAIPPGHDAETIGDEPCVMVDFGEISHYAKH